ETHKRKVSDGAPPGADLKRHKGDDATAAETASLAATNGSDDEDGDEDVDSASDTPTASLVHSLDGTGPFVFYCWADAIYGLVDLGPVEIPYFTLKAAALEAWGHVQHLPKDDIYEALGDHIHIVRRYIVDLPEGATETPGVKALQKAWEVAAADAREDEKDAKDDDKDGEPGWWYELEVQREKPEDGPALELELEGQGRWWLTGFREADREGRRAMTALVDYLAVDY
ncbi:hypothetical protein EIP86_005512, partial [Pleurotus ostreatoroseus]